MQATPPLDPAAALALAVRLSLHVDVSSTGVSVWYWIDGECDSADEDFAAGTDRLAATCRAIARAVEAVESAGDTDLICGSCNGSGEGQHDGTTCRSCRGSGSASRETDDGRDWDAERKDQIERDLMGELA